MAASTLRFAILLALVVAGVVLINNAFDVSGTESSGGLPDGGITSSPSPTTSPTPTETPSESTPSPTVTGTVIVVENAAGVDGLAGDLTTKLVDKYGYEALEPGTAPSLSSNTTIYYAKRKDKIEAEFLANDFFKKIEDTVRVAPLPDDQEFDPTVQLAIFVGTDWAAVA